MDNPFYQLDKLFARHRSDFARVEAVVTTVKATRLKVLDTGIWKCRFKTYGSTAAEDVRANSADELVQKLTALYEKSEVSRKAAKTEKVERRKRHRAQVASTRAELKELGATRFRLRSVGKGAYRWMCLLRSGSTRVTTEFDEPSADRLLAAVRSFRAAERS